MDIQHNFDRQAEAPSCPPSTAADAEPAASASSAGSGSQPSAQQQSLQQPVRSLLTIKLDRPVTPELHDSLLRALSPMVDRLGCEVLVHGPELDAALTCDPTVLVSALHGYAQSNMALTAAVGQLAAMVHDLLARVPLPDDDADPQAMSGKRGGIRRG